VASITRVENRDTENLYPQNGYTGWPCDNYGPIWIPKKGESIRLTLENLPIYERPIRVYEGNELQVTTDGKILINGEETTEYTFRMDYYWMQGDNRYNSADSRYWGFVPEDHIVGKPIIIWLSTDKDRGWFGGHIRWTRLFRFVDGMK
jgi:signal peptidase I